MAFEKHKVVSFFVGQHFCSCSRSSESDIAKTVRRFFFMDGNKRERKSQLLLLVKPLKLEVQLIFSKKLEKLSLKHLKI